MPTKSHVIARLYGSDGFASVEVRVRGPDNVQRQCSTGELEFDAGSYKFKPVAKDKRRKTFDPTSVDPAKIAIRASLDERRGKPRANTAGTPA